MITSLGWFASAVVFDTVAVLSDGLPTTGTVTEPGELRRRVRDWNRFARVRLHAVAVGDSADLLAGLAADSGGASVVR